MSESARVVFRTDADRDIGTGHVVRCLALANLLAADGHAIAFASSPATMRTAGALRDPNIEILVLDTDARPSALFLGRMLS